MCTIQKHSNTFNKILKILKRNVHGIYNLTNYTEKYIIKLTTCISINIIINIGNFMLFIGFITMD